LLEHISEIKLINAVIWEGHSGSAKNINLVLAVISKKIYREDFCVTRAGITQ